MQIRAVVTSVIAVTKSTLSLDRSRIMSAWIRCVADWKLNGSYCVGCHDIPLRGSSYLGNHVRCNRAGFAGWTDHRGVVFVH